MKSTTVRTIGAGAIASSRLRVIFTDKDSFRRLQGAEDIACVSLIAMTLQGLWAVRFERGVIKPIFNALLVFLSAGTLGSFCIGQNRKELI